MKIPTDPEVVMRVLFSLVYSSVHPNFDCKIGTVAAVAKKVIGNESTPNPREITYIHKKHIFG